MSQEDELVSIRDKIEVMPKFNQLEVLKILHAENIVLNENKYGVHINLSELKPVIIVKLKEYINYVTVQENNLNLFETEKNMYKNLFI